MILEVSKVTQLDVPPATTWALLRDVPRLSACIPKVSDVREVEPERRYAAVVADRIGPFSLAVPVTIEVREVEPPRRITAALAGDDRKGQARVRGTLEATADAADGSSTALSLSMKMELLGRLATLGAVPIRRRADEVFKEFVERIHAELAT
ncbi:MAG TPA: SRPBCC domain-containing protein [Chloroflexota bacterium]|nr:SRPBCC domain-containing protein [Chloroflexota bacterium]